MSTIKKYLPWTIRIIIFALFLLSAVAKMFPIWAFEKQIVDLGLASWCQASYLSRLIIALELAIAFAILQPHFLKSIVIPVTIGLLAVFCIHLTIEMVKHGAMNGNCGCFGQLLPMTPLEATLKNLVTIALLIYLYRHVQDLERGKNRFVYLLLIYLASALVMFIFFPFCPCKAETTPTGVDNVQDTASVITEETEDTLAASPVVTSQVSGADSLVQKPAAPSSIKSRFHGFNTFGSQKTNIDAGKKLLCFFAPGCDHCQHAAKDLCKMSAGKAFPKVFIVFIDEETEKIPEFFQYAGCKFPYQVLDIPNFFKFLGDDATPNVHYLWNGHELKTFSGTEERKFDAAALQKAVDTPWNE